MLRTDAQNIEIQFVCSVLVVRNILNKVLSPHLLTQLLKNIHDAPHQKLTVHFLTTHAKQKVNQTQNPSHKNPLDP